MLLSSFGFLKRECIGSNQVGRPLKARKQYKYNEYTAFTQQGTKKDMIVNHQTGKLQIF